MTYRSQTDGQGAEDTDSPSDPNRGWAMHPSVLGAREGWDAEKTARYAQAYADAQARLKEFYRAKWAEALEELAETFQTEAMGDSLAAFVLSVLGDDPGPQTRRLTVGRSGKALAVFKGDPKRWARFCRQEDKGAARGRVAEQAPAHFAAGDPRPAHVWTRLCKVPGLAAAAKEAGLLVRGVDYRTGHTAMALHPDIHPGGEWDGKRVAEPGLPLATTDGEVLLSGGLVIPPEGALGDLLRAAGLAVDIELPTGLAKSPGCPPGWRVSPAPGAARPCLVATPEGAAWVAAQGGTLAVALRFRGGTE